MNRVQAVLTLADLDREHPLFTLAELSQITGRSRGALMLDIERGDLVAFRFKDRPGSAYKILPSEAKAWWDRVTSRSHHRKSQPHESTGRTEP